MTFYSIMITNDSINAQMNLFPLKNLIAITIVFHISYQYAILSEIILNMTLRDSHYDRLLRYFIP